MDSSNSTTQIAVEYDEVDGLGKLIKKASWSKSRQKVEELSKSLKNLEGLKSCKGHWFGGTFTNAPILCQFIDKKNSSL